MRYTPPVHDDPERRELLRAALWLLGSSALAGSFELLALQAPGSPLYLGVLPGPVALLRELSLTLGLLLLGAELLAARAASPLPRSLRRTLVGGAVLAVLAQAYGAALGMYGLQVLDLRADALPMFVVKHAALAAFVVAYGRLGVRALRAPPPAP
jgi:hypothetical protein